MNQLSKCCGVQVKDAKVHGVPFKICPQCYSPVHVELVHKIGNTWTNAKEVAVWKQTSEGEHDTFEFSHIEPTTPTTKDGQTADEIAEILGLEDSPAGEKYYLLIRENGVVVEGMDFSEEIEAIDQLIEECCAEAEQKGYLEGLRTADAIGSSSGIQKHISQEMKRQSEPQAQQSSTKEADGKS